MMKKKNTATVIKTGMAFLFVACLWSCDSEYEPVFNESPDERVRSEMSRYEELLISAPYGWTASLYTGVGSGYFYYFDFQEEGTVSMLSDFNATTAGDVMESTWSLKALQQITLSFTTYSYIHLPADPDADISNGIPGSGLLSDFEFSFAGTSGDSVVMKGIKNKTEFVLVRSTEAEQQAYLDKRIQYLLERADEFLGDYRSYTLSLPNDLTIPMAMSLDTRMISFQFVEGETIQSPVTSYTFSTEGILLKDPIHINGSVIDKLLWDDDDAMFYVPLDEPVALVGSNDPFILSPPTPLYESLGHELVTIALPGNATTNPIPGQSDQFTFLLSNAAQQMLDGPYRLTLEQIRYVFVPNTDRMLMIVVITQPTTGGGVSRFSAQYTYSYQVRDGGVLKFKLELSDGNAGLLYADLAEILSHFDNDTFKIEYVGGGFQLIGSFFSQEESEYYFGGYILE